MSQEIATRRVSEVIRVSASLAYASGYDWCQSGAVQLVSGIDVIYELSSV